MLGVALFIISSLLIFIVKVLRKNPKPIFGIYRRKNGVYWLKVAAIYSVLCFKKVTRLLKKEDRSVILSSDSAQELSHHEKAIDAVYFNGATKNGDHIVVGVARRKNMLVDGFVYLKINSSKYGLLESIKLPSTALYKSELNDDFSAEGIKITPLHPMKTWKVSYNGKMKEAKNRDKIHDVKFEGIWTAVSPHFSYDTDMDNLLMAKAISHEEWSKEYFQNLEKNHQVHYEQFGKLKLNVEIDGENHDATFDAARDHTFGNHREWRNFYRYALHYCTTDNGDHFAVVSVCAPITFSRLIIGYVYSANEQRTHPISSCGFELYQHGNLGKPPVDYAFSFYAGRKKYIMQVNVNDSSYFYISKDWEAKIFENFCTFKVNGVKGWGATEWQYRNVIGKDDLKS